MELRLLLALLVGLDDDAIPELEKDFMPDIDELLRNAELLDERFDGVAGDLDLCLFGVGVALARPLLPS
jgi:hypothetical protein